MFDEAEVIMTMQMKIFLLADYQFNKSNQRSTKGMTSIFNHSLYFL